MSDLRVYAIGDNFEYSLSEEWSEISSWNKTINFQGQRQSAEKDSIRQINILFESNFWSIKLPDPMELSEGYTFEVTLQVPLSGKFGQVAYSTQHLGTYKPNMHGIPIGFKTIGYALHIKVYEQIKQLEDNHRIWVGGKLVYEGPRPSWINGSPLKSSEEAEFYNKSLGVPHLRYSR